MTRRRPPRRDDLGVETTLRRAADIAPEVELGWSEIRQKMRDAGWPQRGPGANGTNGDGDPGGIDYADPAGDLALRLDQLAGDLEAMQDHWELVVTSLRAMARIARRHLPVSSPAVPACDLTSCDQPVEARVLPGGRMVYLGMEQIAGVWVAKPGFRPTCSKHRRERGAA